MTNKTIYSPRSFNNVQELIVILSDLQTEATLMEENNPIVHVRANQFYVNGRAYLQIETLTDGSVVYSVVLEAD